MILCVEVFLWIEIWEIIGYFSKWEGFGYNVFWIKSLRFVFNKCIKCFNLKVYFILVYNYKG